VQTVKKASVGKAEVKAGAETEAGAEAGVEVETEAGVEVETDVETDAETEVGTEVEVEVHAGNMIHRLKAKRRIEAAQKMTLDHCHNDRLYPGHHPGHPAISALPISYF